METDVDECEIHTCGVCGFRAASILYYFYNSVSCVLASCRILDRLSLLARVKAARGENPDEAS